MHAWSNIEISTQDPEIIEIDQLEEKLGIIPDDVYKIRELITRYEVCHFKSRQHIEKIKDSIENLKPEVVPATIGINHIKEGENAWKNDASGKSLMGQQYIWAIKIWLGELPFQEKLENHDADLEQNVQQWLGAKNEDKLRLVRLLLARLCWHWKSLEELQCAGEYKDLESQIIRVDICHYDFPSNLYKLLHGIGKMKPVENFNGCGSFNKNIREQVARELTELNKLLKSHNIKDGSKQNDQIKAWLTACMIKTLKEQIGLSEPTIEL